MRVLIQHNQLDVTVIWVVNIKIITFTIGDIHIFFDTETIRLALPDLRNEDLPYFAIPIAPQGNGYAERMNRRIRHFMLSDFSYLRQREQHFA